MTALETLRPELTAHVEAVRAIGRRAAESVRDLGVALAAAKGDCRHGEWLPFLAAAGVPERFAQRAIRYSKLLPKSDNLSDLPAPSKLLGEAARPGRYQMSFADECEHFLIGMLAAGNRRHATQGGNGTVCWPDAGDGGRGDAEAWRFGRAPASEPPYVTTRRPGPYKRRRRPGSPFWSRSAPSD